jgi:hypothetical protein
MTGPGESAVVRLYPLSGLPRELGGRHSRFGDRCARRIPASARQPSPTLHSADDALAPGPSLYGRFQARPDHPVRRAENGQRRTAPTDPERISCARSWAGRHHASRGVSSGAHGERRVKPAGAADGDAIVRTQKPRALHPGRQGQLHVKKPAQVGQYRSPRLSLASMARWTCMSSAYLSSIERSFQPMRRMRLPSSPPPSSQSWTKVTELVWVNVDVRVVAGLDGPALDHLVHA